MHAGADSQVDLGVHKGVVLGKKTVEWFFVTIQLTARLR